MGKRKKYWLNQKSCLNQTLFSLFFHFGKSEILPKSKILHKLHYCKVLSLLEACFYLIWSPSPSMKIQIMSEKITENLECESWLRKVKFFFPFLFIFKFSIKNSTSLFLAIFEYLVLNQTLSICYI